MSVKGNCAICINPEAHYGEYCQKCREEGYRRIMIESFESKTEKRISKLEEKYNKLKKRYDSHSHSGAK